MSGCCCFTWSKTFTFVGMFLSFFELIVAAVYNFHAMGFVMAVIGIIISFVYLFFILRDGNVQEKETLNDTDSGKGSINEEDS